ncbi:MAG: PAS domain S-box protein [Proteobacteria bacterium]|nr:PAS domain S-box protein [Pseudomonadota bacterium]MBU1060825.1 PAS domain S-box protein [Pseudomonadota bacterium]
MLFVIANLALALLETVFSWTHMNHSILLAWLTLLIVTCLALTLSHSPVIWKKTEPASRNPRVAKVLIFFLAAIWASQAFFMPLTAPDVLLFHSPALILLGVLFTLELSPQLFPILLVLFLLLSPTLYLFFREGGSLLQPALVISLLALFLPTFIFRKPLFAPSFSVSQATPQEYALPAASSRGLSSSANHCLSPDDVIWESILKITNPESLHTDWQNCFAEIHSGICKALQADTFFLLRKETDTPASLTVTEEEEQTNLSPQSWILSVPTWITLLSKGTIIHNLRENFSEKEGQTLKEDGVKTLLLVPLRVKKELWGLIGLERRHSATLFSQQQINSLRFIANILAMSISNQRDRSERDRLVTVVEQSSDCIIITDTDGAVLYANPACETVTGYLPQEILGNSIKLLYPPSVRHNLWLPIQKALITGEGWNGQFTNYKKDNTLYEEEMHISPVHDHESPVANRVIVKRNITEEKRLESIAEAANLMDNIGFVFSSIRHELGNPINSIKVSLSILEANLETYDTANIKRFVSRSLSDIGRVEYLLKTLKNFSVFERPHIEATDMRALLDKLFQLTEKDLAKQNVTLKIHHPSQPLSGLVDPRAFLQVLLNLITNAVAALEGCQDKEITITMTGEQNGQITFSLADNGCGMEEETIRNLFRPFFTTKAEGTGLGLVIVKKMLAKMNCSIEARSWKDMGTQIQIIIPGA